MLGVSGKVVGSCIAGAGLMMASLLFPVSRLHDIEGASAGWVTDKENHVDLHILPLPEPGSTSKLPDQSAPLLSQPIDERVAADILLRSGLITSATISRTEASADAAGGSVQYTSASFTYAMKVDPAISACVSIPAEAAQPKQPADPQSASPGKAIPDAAATRQQPEPVQDQTDEEVGQLAVAVLAVERTYRNPFQRWLEMQLAHWELRLFGHLPDFSLGSAQLRPSTLRGLPKNMVGGPSDVIRRDDHAMLSALADDCQAYGLAAALLQYYLHRTNNMADAAALYVGRATRHFDPAIIDYQPVVVAAAGMLTLQR